MKSYFPKRVKPQSKKKWTCNANTKFDYLLENSFSHRNNCIYTNLWRALFQNMISEFAIAIATSICGLALSAFRKRALQIYEQLLYKTQSTNCIGIANPSFGIALTAFSKELFLNVHSSSWMWMYMLMKHSFTKHDLWTWHWHCKLDFCFDWCFSRFGKELFI